MLDRITRTKLEYIILLIVSSILQDGYCKIASNQLFNSTVFKTIQQKRFNNTKLLFPDFHMLIRGIYKQHLLVLLKHPVNQKSLKIFA